MSAITRSLMGHLVHRLVGERIARDNRYTRDRGRWRSAKRLRQRASQVGGHLFLARSTGGCQTDRGFTSDQSFHSWTTQVVQSRTSRSTDTLGRLSWTRTCYNDVKLNLRFHILKLVSVNTVTIQLVIDYRRVIKPKMTTKHHRINGCQISNLT